MMEVDDEADARADGAGRAGGLRSLSGGRMLPCAGGVLGYAGPAGGCSRWHGRKDPGDGNTLRGDRRLRGT